MQWARQIIHFSIFFDAVSVEYIDTNLIQNFRGTVAVTSLTNNFNIVIQNNVDIICTNRIIVPTNNDILIIVNAGTSPIMF